MYLYTYIVYIKMKSMFTVMLLFVTDVKYRTGYTYIWICISVWQSSF